MKDRITIEIDGRNCIGLDVGDRKSVYHVSDPRGEEIARGKVETTPWAIDDVFRAMRPARIALEVGTHSPWISELLDGLGHEVVVANASRVALVTKNRRKNDRVDAKYLSWLLRVDPRLLFPIRHRGMQARADLAVVRTRSHLVAQRTSHINHVRGVVKSCGRRIPSMSPESFGRRAGEYIPEDFGRVLWPVLQIITHLNSVIREQDREIDRLCQEQYPETKRLTQVVGVGNITALTFVLVIDDPSRFDRAREAGPYVGLVPRTRASGGVDPELSITKAGDRELRWLLVQCAHHVLGRRGRDSDLRRWGLGMAERGKKNAKKKAVVAVARRLAVLLLALWRNGEDYEPLRQAAA